MQNLEMPEDLEPARLVNSRPQKPAAASDLNIY
jgi:hypothetical protein